MRCIPLYVHVLVYKVLWRNMLPIKPGADFTNVYVCDHRYHTCDEIANLKSIAIAMSLILRFTKVIAIAMTLKGK